MKRLFRYPAARLLLAAALLPACQRPEAVVPPTDLLPRDKMVGLLLETHLLEVQAENARLSPDSARALFLEQQKNLFWRREVSDSAFRRSYRYYSAHGTDLDEIYGAVLDSLGQREYQLKVN